MFNIKSNENIVGIGCDIIKIDRISKIHKKSSLLACKILSKKEFNILQNKDINQQCKYLAKRWCAKEAIFKAIPNSKNFITNAKYIEILNDELGAPYVNLLPSIYENIENMHSKYNIHISISDEKDYAISFCIVIKM